MRRPLPYLETVAVLAGLLLCLWVPGAAAGQLFLSWTDNTGGTTKTAIERSDNGGEYVWIGDVQQLGVTEFWDLHVPPGQRSCYRVYAFLGDDWSDYSNEKCADTKNDGGPLGCQPTVPVCEVGP